MKYDFKDWSVIDLKDFKDLVFKMAVETVHADQNKGMTAISDKTGIGLHIVKIAYGVILALRDFRGEVKSDIPRNFRPSKD